MTRPGPLLAALLLASSSFRAWALSSEEQAILRHVDARTDGAIALLSRAVDIESPTEDLAGVERVGKLFRGELDALGFETEWLAMPPEMKRAGHLIARTRGTKGKRLLLLGHIDTVLSGEKFSRSGERGYGTGTTDMKAGIVLLIEALRALHAADALGDARIIVFLTGDEENVGRPFEKSRGPLVAAAEQSDLILSFEATVRDTATVGRRGSSDWTLEVEGRAGHSGQIFSESLGSGAVFEAARILAAFHETLRGEKYLTFNPSLILGGTRAERIETSGSATGKRNVVAARALVTGDLRFLSEEQRESARARMREIVSRSLPGTSAQITFEDRYPAMTPSPGAHDLLEQLNQVSLDLDYGPVVALDPSERGAGDIGFVSHLRPALDGIGALDGENAHAPGEWVDLESLPRLTRRAALLIYRLTR